MPSTVRRFLSFLALAVALTGCSDAVGAGGTEQLAFVRWDSAAAGSYSVYRLDLRSGRTTNLNPAGVDVWIPAWSPDGSKIAFNSDQDGTGQEIFAMNADGSGVQRLTNIVGSVFCPSWSPDGKKIIFDREGPFGGLYAMNADGSDTTRLAYGTHGFYQCPVWSPDGSRIAFVSTLSPTAVIPMEIFLVNADGTGEVDWSNNPDGEDNLPAWSPDGKRIAFYSERNGVNGIYVMNVDGTDLRPLVTSPGRNDCPSWSPNGTWIAFSSNRDQTHAGNWQIYAVSADGAQQTRMTNDVKGDMCPRWQP